MKAFFCSKDVFESAVIDLWKLLVILFCSMIYNPPTEKAKSFLSTIFKVLLAFVLCLLFLFILLIESISMFLGIICQAKNSFLLKMRFLDQVFR